MDNEIKDFLRCQPKHLMGGAPLLKPFPNPTAVAAALIAQTGGCTCLGPAIATVAAAVAQPLSCELDAEGP